MKFSNRVEWMIISIRCLFILRQFKVWLWCLGLTAILEVLNPRAATRWRESRIRLWWWPPSRARKSYIWCRLHPSSWCQLTERNSSHSQLSGGSCRVPPYQGQPTIQIRSFCFRKPTKKTCLLVWFCGSIRQLWGRKSQFKWWRLRWRIQNRIHSEVARLGSFWQNRAQRVRHQASQLSWHQIPIHLLFSTRSHGQAKIAPSLNPSYEFAKWYPYP